MPHPLLLIDPHPRTLDEICDSSTRQRLEALGRLVIHEEGTMPAEVVDRHIAEASLTSVRQTCPRKGYKGRIPPM